MKKNIGISILVAILLHTIVTASIISYSFDTSLQEDTRIVATEIIRSDSVVLQIITDRANTCKYSTSAQTPYVAMTETFDINLETIHKKTLTGLSDGLHTYYIRCKNSSNVISNQLETVFPVDRAVSAQIIIDGDSPIKQGRTEIKLVTSKILSQTPSLSYSFDGISYNPIPLTGSGTIWTGYIIVPDSIEEEVGSFRFQGRDLEGIIGETITQGGIFLIDTLKPTTILDIKAEGHSGRIQLNWFVEKNQDIDEFHIYRSTSPNVGHADFYTETESNSFSDTSVEKGKTYYYKINAIDKAQNQGDLSPEVYATALLTSTTTNSFELEARFLGIVDNVITDIDFVIDQTDKNKKDLLNGNDIESEIANNLKLNREIESAQSELNSLKNEVANFKTQSLSSTELDKKLNAAKLRLKTIKKKIPETISIIAERQVSGDFSENDLTAVILEQKPDIADSTLQKTLEKSKALKENDQFNIDRQGYMLQIIYADGSQNELSLIKTKINPTLENNKSIKIIEDIPETIAKSITEIDIKNINYEILKENAIVSFQSNTEEIIYAINKHIDLNLLESIRTMPLYEVQEEIKNSPFTGYLTFIDFNPNKYSGLLVGILAIAGLGIYFIILKRKSKFAEKLMPFKEQLTEAEQALNSNETKNAQHIYNALCHQYKHYGQKEKKLIYPQLEKLRQKLEVNHA